MPRDGGGRNIRVNIIISKIPKYGRIMPRNVEMRVLFSNGYGQTFNCSKSVLKLSIVNLSIRWKNCNLTVPLASAHQRQQIKNWINGSVYGYTQPTAIFFYFLRFYDNCQYDTIRPSSSADDTFAKLTISVQNPRDRVVRRFTKQNGV